MGNSNVIYLVTLILIYVYSVYYYGGDDQMFSVCFYKSYHQFDYWVKGVMYMFVMTKE